MAQAPNCGTTLRDPNTGINYRVLAYRVLTKLELVLVIRAYLCSTTIKPIAGQSVVISTGIGRANEPDANSSRPS